jgi:tagatose 1,6-diphosphate aldolase
MPVTVPFKQETLPLPIKKLSSGSVILRRDKVVPGEPARGFVPYYHFRVLTADGSDVGHINFRVGEAEHIRLFTGHIGFEIRETYRGHGYALQACRAIAPLVRSLYETVVITCDPDNIASRRTIERLGASFIDEIAVPPDEPHYVCGSRAKRRYRWRP